MKSFFVKLSLVALVAFAGVFAGCNPTDGMKSFSVAVKEAGPGYVMLDVTVPSPTEVAFVCGTSARDNLTAAQIFMAGTKVTFNESGEQQIVADIVANTKYYLYLTARLSATEYSEVYRFEFETGEFVFDQLCTVVATMPDGYKMHISVPPSVKNSTPGTPGSRGIRYNQCDLMLYNLRRKTADEYWMLLTNAGACVTEDRTLEYSDDLNRDQSVEDTDGDGDVDVDDLTYKWNPISPGEPVVFVAGEFEWMELPEEYQGKDAPNYAVDGWQYPAGWPSGYYLPMIDGDAYDAYYASQSKGVGIIDDLDKSSDIDELWTGAFQKKVFRTSIPSKLDAEVKMEVADLGPVDATLIFTPDPEIQFFCFGVFDDGTYQEMLKLLDGREEYLQWAVSSFFALYNFGTMMAEGPTELVLSELFYDVPASTNFHVLVTGMGKEDGSTQCFHHYEFATPQKTKTTGPVIEVTPLPEQSSPFEAKFLVKCTTPENKAKRCYYGANYYRDWIYAINSGSTYYALGQSAKFVDSEVEQINSEEGLVVSIPSIDGEETRLVVVAYNDENTPNDLNYEDIEECPAVASVTTPYYEADVCVSYFSMASKLEGDWTMTASVLDTLASGGVKEVSTNVSIMSAYTDFPAELPESVYDIYHKTTKLTDEEIEAHYEDFKNNATVFNTKRLANQNKLLLTGWIDGGVYGSYQTLTPYDLFIHEKISTVDVKSMFSDFGPKMFLEVSEVDGKAKLTVTGDYMFGNPVMNWSAPFYLAARANQDTNNTIFYYTDNIGYYAAPLVFDIEYSDDYNTLTIKAIERNGVKFFPNVIGQDPQTGRYLLDFPIVSEVVLTRGVTSAAAVSCTKATNAVSMSAEPARISHKPMTRLDKPVKRNRIEMKPVTMEKLHENFDKYLEFMDNQTR